MAISHVDKAPWAIETRMQGEKSPDCTRGRSLKELLVKITPIVGNVDKVGILLNSVAVLSNSALVLSNSALVLSKIRPVE